MSFFDFLSKKGMDCKKASVQKETEAVKEETAAEKVPPKEPYLSAWYTYGMHQYRSADEDSTVYYIDESRGIQKKIVDRTGHILDFPGIREEDFWVKDVPPRYLHPQIHFRTDFERRDGKIIMLWQVQPDGRYWEDEDGYGMTSDEEITLYAFLTEEGTFDGPFRIYRVGDHKYYQG